jgi:branched-chain amino acid transport system substrate-binding protein
VRRIFLPLIALVVLGGVVLSCGDDDEGPVKLGFLAGLSGDYAEWGPPSQDGAEAAIGVINDNGGILGRDAELVVQDNLSTAEGAVTGYNRIREEIDALGGVESDGAVALLDTLAEDEMPTMCPACGTTVLDTKGGNYIWRITASDTTYGIISAQLARDAGYMRVAMLVQQTEGTESPAEVFKDVWENKIGREITEDVRFNPGLDSYQAQVEQAFAGNPDAVYIGAGPQAGIPILREYMSRGYETPILVSPDLQVPDIAEVAAELPTGTVLAAQVTDAFDSPAYAAFAAAHQEYAGKAPPTGFYETNQFDQYIVLALAMTAAESTDGPDVAAQIYNIVNAPGTKVYTYADGLAALERGEQIDYDGPSGSIELHTTTGNLISPKVAVNHIVNGSYTEREVIELDASLGR